MSKIKRENVEQISEQRSPASATKKVKVEIVETASESNYGDRFVNGATRIKSKEGHVLYKCRQLILNIKNSLSKQKKDTCKETLDNWKKDLEELEKQLIIPKVTIAVVGATGAGKSSLINAVVDQFSVLPTSGTQACTSVVVKIENNKDADHYEADIEFLSKEEWQIEHDVLIKDMTKNDGTMKTYRPDDQSEAFGVAFLKMRAVYGQFSSLNDLNGENDITSNLGTMKHLKSNKLQEFSCNIEKYIISTEEEGQHLWPIIKSVTIRIPNFFTGCTLVDLPGVGDANAARDRIAQEHLENCSNILVVAEVHRAFSSKIAKELMGKSFRRQLFMDGNYSSDNIAFICTKNDNLNHVNCRDLTRELKLDKNDELMSLKIKSEDLKNALNDTDGNERLQIQKDLSQTQQAMKVICGKARSEKARKQLKKDYKSGLRDMKRFAKQGIDGDDEDEDDEDEDEDNDNNDDNNDDNLRVFCVSSNDYQCLKEVNEPPTVFDNVEDTEIPKLRKWIKEIVERKKQAATDCLIYNLGFFLSSIKNYLAENDVEFKDDPEIVKSEVEKVCEELQQELQNTSVKLLYELRKEISKIEYNLAKGAKSAEEAAMAVCKRWGEKYHGQTYKAVVNRHGVYKSRSVGEVNFNYQLVSPLIISILIRWTNFFHEDLWKIVDNYNEIILEKNIRVYISKLSDKVKDCIPPPQLEKLKERLDLNAWKKLDNNIDELKDFVDRRQRHIHRLSSSKIQSILKQIYEECSADKGKGVIQRMKMKLEKGIDTQRKDMFQEVLKEIVAELKALMEVIKEDILSVCTKLVRTIKMMFEPLWTHAATQDLRSTLFDDVDKAEQELTTLCDIFGIKKDFGSKTRTGRSSATADLLLDFTGEGSLLTTPLLCDGISIDCIADKRLDERHFITNVKDKDMNCLLSNLNQQKSDEFTCLISFLHFFKDRHTLDSKSIHQLLKHAVSNGQSLMCRLALSFIGDILKSEPLITQMLILALVNDEKDCAKAISWFIVRAFYLQNRFAIKQSLVEDIWPAIRCMSTNRASRSPCLEDVVIVVELGSDRPNIPKEFCQIQVMFLTKGDISSSERLLANSQLKNRNESLYLQESIVSGIDAENLFTKHSKLTLICKSYTTFFENDSQHNYRQVPYVKLFCRAKGYIPIGEDRFPREVCGMPTDILQGAPSLMANLKVGSKIGGEVNKMGTLGGFVKVRGDTCFLTCCHVLLSVEDLASENISLDDDKWIEVQCYFPGSPTDHKQIKSYKCGRIRDIAFEVDNANETSIDAALVTLNDGIQIHEKDYLENGHGQSYPCSVLGMQSTFLNKNSVDYKQFCYSTPRQTVDIVTVGAVSGLNTTYRSIVDENNETSINIESLLQTFSTAKTAVVKEGVIFAIQKIRGMNISNISSDHIRGAIEDVCDAKISKDVKILLADITTTWFQTVENAHENMDTNTNNIFSQTVENEHENMDTNTNNISSQTVENEHENMDTNTNNIQENSTFYEARDLAHLQSSEWEMIDQIIKSKTERVSSTITGDVHMQEMCLINTEDRLNKMRTSRRMYNQIHVSDIRFKPGDSGTCLYIISPVQGCLGMAIANHPQGGCIATPIKEILKHFKIKIN